MQLVTNGLSSLWGKSGTNTSTDTKSHIRRIAVVGAGPTGISAAKFLLGEQQFDQIDVFEQQASFGGAWIWSQPDSSDRPVVPQTNPLGPLDRVKLDESENEKPPMVLTPMYDNLETNIPHILMRFSEKHFPSDSLLFPSRTTVLKYIEDYSKEVEHLVKFNHQVIYLSLGKGADGADLWTLRHKDVRTGRIKEEYYDAVALANGHFSLTSIPDIPGIRQWDLAYPGTVQHAKYYRNSDAYINKKVVIVGNASSGIDIGSQIAVKCQKPLIMAARSEPLFKMPAYAEHVNLPDIAEFIDPKLGNRAVRFKNGHVEDNVDQVLFCTGYFLSFPFLDPALQEQLINNGSMVHGTYQHMFWIQHPSLAFLGLLNKVLPLPLGEAQATALARVWSGRLQLPPIPKMQVWEHQRWRQVVDMLSAKGKSTEAWYVEKNFLGMGPGQDMAYHNELVQWASQATGGPGRPLPHIWTKKEIWIRSQMAPMKKAYAELGVNKHKARTIEDLGIDYEKFIQEQGK